jgi:hypothetical protein
VTVHLVWSRPMTKVAEDLGISDVALKKICDKHRVPTPPRGYWAKKDAGKPTKQTQFHNTADPQHDHIVIHGSRNNLAPAVREVLNQERGRRKSKPRAASPAEFGPTAPLQDVNPAIAATAKALRKAKPDADQVVRANGQDHCGIEVGASSVERTIAILDAIARALDARGLKVEPAGNCIRVALPPDNVTFSLVERIERRDHVPTMEELSREERRRKKQERDARLGIWSYGQERAYPELTSFALVSSAFRLRMNMSEVYVAIGVTGSVKKSIGSWTTSLPGLPPIWQVLRPNASNESAGIASGSGGNDLQHLPAPVRSGRRSVTNT